ncbi:MAG TPA: metal-dependent transcriptional regulator [Gemmatimonadales bacterium]|nr:metal-dependent transcriptional regulator [Gemmatimonadales bacterium]
MSAAIAGNGVTRSVEDYLKVIYRLSTEGRPASTSEIAQALELAPASVSGMIKRLSEQGLLDHEPYRGAQLTDEGRRIALRMVRRHRLIESYLVAALGYSWDTVHDEAERLEHAVSDLLIERMAAAMGHPTADPHGDPIPAADGSIEADDSVPLPDVPSGATIEIRRVNTDNPALLRHLAERGLRPGVRLLVTDRQPFSGPLTVRIGDAEQVVGAEVARSLRCAPAGGTGGAA